MNKEKAFKRKIRNYILTPLILCVLLFALSIGVYYVNRNAGFVCFAGVSVFVIVDVVVYMFICNGMMPMLTRFALEQGQVQKELLKELAVPYALLDTDGKILWGNNQFVEAMGAGSRKKIRKNISAFFPAIGTELLSGDEPLDMVLEYNDVSYSALLKKIKFDEEFSDEDAIVAAKGEYLIAFYLFDITELNRYKKENEEQKLVAGLLYIDNYDEVMENTEEGRHSLIEALVDRRINMYLETIDSIGKKIEKDKYLFVFKQKFLPLLKETKFAILDEVKSINVGNEIPVTVSIGIGVENTSFAKAYEYSRVAIGLALARGGDQVAVKSSEAISYFGGKSAGTEKTTRVKARVKAQAFRELMQNKDVAIIMGHKDPDTDSFGAAVGFYRLVTSMGKKAHIVLNDDTAAITPILNCFVGNSVYGDDMIINSEEAIAKIGSTNALVVVVDVNAPNRTECPELIDLADSLVVLDHHRIQGPVINNATLSYIEQYASSSCEMVAEMLQYGDDNVKIRPAEADAMYAGIVIDTNSFVQKTGVRTFEAASYLRRCGADVVRVTKMLRTDMATHKLLAEGLLNSEVFMNCFAFSTVSLEGSGVTELPTVMAAKVANDLLSIDGVRASFVVTQHNGCACISARAADEMNVQVLMEKLGGGGGHANIAGAQFKDTTNEEAINKVKELLKEMYSEGDL